jgi:hypothetical protein
LIIYRNVGPLNPSAALRLVAFLAATSLTAENLVPALLMVGTVARAANDPLGWEYHPTRAMLPSFCSGTQGRRRFRRVFQKIEDPGAISSREDDMCMPRRNPLRDRQGGAPVRLKTHTSPPVNVEFSSTKQSLLPKGSKQ